MRKLISAMKISLDGKISGPDGSDADWVNGWSDDYGLTEHIDACVIGGLYPGYEQYWTGIQQEPEKILPETNKKPTPGEVKWARFAEHTPHYVLSGTVSSTLWPLTHFIRGIEDVAELKKQGGKDIYIIGGARTVANLIDAGLVDELRLIVYPLIAGDGRALFGTTKRRQLLNLRETHQLSDGRVMLIYDIKATTNS
jgi:dihydrofolate reductase